MAAQGDLLEAGNGSELKQQSGSDNLKAIATYEEDLTLNT